MLTPVIELKSKLKGISESASVERDRIRNNIQLIGINSTTTTPTTPPTTNTTTTKNN